MEYEGARHEPSEVTSSGSPPLQAPPLPPPPRRVPARLAARLPRARRPLRAAAPPGATGKVVHDDRGNAVWDWLTTTSRLAIEATSRLLRKLEMPELKVEDTKDEELRIAPEPGSGAGYDPYNQAVKPPKKPGSK